MKTFKDCHQQLQSLRTEPARLVLPSIRISSAKQHQPKWLTLYSTIILVIIKICIILIVSILERFEVNKVLLNKVIIFKLQLYSLAWTHCSTKASLIISEKNPMRSFISMVISKEFTFLVQNASYSTKIEVVKS
ncbi:hypothetical protein FGO68_gene10687 [Halteria grandinella]|uniref:Transmembrane protein n=1 Tax=Halteria grandinella TaxID=5974 RepID=A0A8J8T6F8_HALGN|nr:hypothetical protein FGO68_gene10687 [Halteria grandinella]